jgi:hypothetical protein
VDLDVTFDPVEGATLYVDITYAVRGTNDPRNLVFPFYVIPPEESPGSANGAVPQPTQIGRQ